MTIKKKEVTLIQTSNKTIGNIDLQKETPLFQNHNP